MPMPAANTRRVVARYRDGRLIKGTTHDFFPGKDRFHVYEGGDESRHAVEVPLGELKAVFFVKSLEGDPEHGRNGVLAVAETGQGRKLAIKFQDGEELVGFSMGYNPAKPGFFVVPVDADGNNIRVFVVKDAVDAVDLL